MVVALLRYFFLLYMKFGSLQELPFLIWFQLVDYDFLKNANLNAEMITVMWKYSFIGRKKRGLFCGFFYTMNRSRPLVVPEFYVDWYLSTIGYYSTCTLRLCNKWQTSEIWPLGATRVVTCLATFSSINLLNNFFLKLDKMSVCTKRV